MAWTYFANVKVLLLCPLRTMMVLRLTPDSASKVSWQWRRMVEPDPGPSPSESPRMTLCVRLAVMRLAITLR